MTTIRRTLVIVILLAICFFIYRGINPQGADRLLTQVRALPETFFGSGNTISHSIPQTGSLVSAQTGTLPLTINQSGKQETPEMVSGLIASSSYLSGFFAWLGIGDTEDLSLVVSGTLASSTGSLEDTLFPTEGKLTIVQPSSQQGQTGISLPPSSGSVPPSSVSTVSVTPNKTAPTVVKAAAVVKKSSSSQLSQQELRETQNLLNHLFH